MTTLIVGGAASGKSAYAERLVARLPRERKRVYIATMRHAGAEAEARIEKHRRQRAGRGFETIECFVSLSSLDVPRGCIALLEDIGNLCANELYTPEGSGDGAMEAIVRGAARLREQCRELVIVSNEVLSGGADYADDTARYLRTIGCVNQRLAALADNVCEVVCGVPLYHKGKEPV